jgi:hypothetical protein
MSTAALRLVPLPDADGAGAGAAPPPLRAAPAEPSAAVSRARPPRKGSDRRRLEMVRTVVSEVEALRPILDEAVRQYELRTAAQLSEILRALQGESAALARPPTVKTTSAMLRAIQAVELKPARGRAKDLVRLHELVAELTELLTPEA